MSGGNSLSNISMCGLSKVLLFVVAVLFRTCTAICAKVVITMAGANGFGIKGMESVQLTLLQTLGMFVGMSVSLFAHAFVVSFRIPFPGYNHDTMPETPRMMDNASRSEGGSAHGNVEANVSRKNHRSGIGDDVSTMVSTEKGLNKKRAGAAAGNRYGWNTDGMHSIVDVFHNGLLTQSCKLTETESSLEESYSEASTLQVGGLLNVVDEEPVILLESPIWSWGSEVDNCQHYHLPYSPLAQHELSSVESMIHSSTKHPLIDSDRTNDEDDLSMDESGDHQLAEAESFASECVTPMVAQFLGDANVKVTKFTPSMHFLIAILAVFDLCSKTLL